MERKVKKDEDQKLKSSPSKTKPISERGKIEPKSSTSQSSPVKAKTPNVKPKQKITSTVSSKKSSSIVTDSTSKTSVRNGSTVTSPSSRSMLSASTSRTPKTSTSPSSTRTQSPSSTRSPSPSSLKLNPSSRTTSPNMTPPTSSKTSPNRTPPTSSRVPTSKSTLKSTAKTPNLSSKSTSTSTKTTSTKTTTTSTKTTTTSTRTTGTSSKSSMTSKTNSSLSSNVGSSSTKVTSSTSKISPKSPSSNKPSSLTKSKPDTTIQHVDVHTSKDVSKSSSDSPPKLSWANRKTLKSSQSTKLSSKGGQYASLSRIASESKASSQEPTKKYVTLRSNTSLSPTPSKSSISPPSKYKSNALEPYCGFYIRSNKFQSLKQYMLTYESKSVYVWDTLKGECVHVFTGHTSDILSISLGYDNLCVSASSDETLMWNFKTGRIEKTWKGSLGASLHPSEKKLAMLIQSPPSIEIYDIQKTRAFKTIRKVNVQCFCWVHGTNKIIGGEEHLIKIWNADTGAVEKIFKGHQANIIQVFSCPDGRECFSTSEDHITKVWNISTSQCIHEYHNKGKEHQFMVYNQKKKTSNEGKDDDIENILSFLIRDQEYLCTMKDQKVNMITEDRIPDETPPYFYLDV